MISYLEGLRYIHIFYTFNFSYDFIVIGGGSGGSVVASRLSEVEKFSVLLLEAGLDEPASTQVPSFFRNYIGSDIDWKYQTEREERACLNKKDRRCPWPRGKVSKIYTKISFSPPTGYPFHPFLIPLNTPLTPCLPLSPPNPSYHPSPFPSPCHRTPYLLFPFLKPSLYSTIPSPFYHLTLLPPTPQHPLIIPFTLLPPHHSSKLSAIPFHISPLASLPSSHTPSTPSLPSIASCPPYLLYTVP